MSTKIIRYKDNKCFFSNDNWNTFGVLVKKTIEADEEKSADIITSIKFRHELGNEKAYLIINELEKIRKMFNMPKNDGYGHAFEVFAISVLHNLDYNTIFNNNIVSGKNDGKIDAIYWNESEVVLYQVKLDMLESSIKKQMKENYLEYLETGIIEADIASDLLNFCIRNKDHLKKDKDLKIFTISTNLSINNYTPIEICQKFFEYQIICKTNNLRLTLDVPKVKSSSNDMVNSLTRSGDDVYAYFTDAKSFIKQLLTCEGILEKENLYKYFYDNVRGNLGINKNMLDTIENEPNNFVKYNNGITITGRVEYKDSVRTLIINNPIISNGQQTVWNLVNKYPEIDSINILIIVKNDSDFSIKSKIARYTNEQKLIKPLDLLSLDEGIRDLQDKIYRLSGNTNDVFLELNSSGEKNYTKIIKKIYTKYGIISLNEFCKLYFSIEDLKLGSWKSTVSHMISELLNKKIVYDVEKALMVCNIIKKYKIYVANIQDQKEKNNLKVADLAFMFIMYTYNLDEEKTHEIIDQINNKYYFDIPDTEKKSKLIDLYKSNDIYLKIETVIKENKYEKINNFVSSDKI